MFGKAKDDAQEKDRLLPPAPQLPASLAESASKEISCIDRGMTVVGNDVGQQAAGAGQSAARSQSRPRLARA
jgi:hypothetical protein